MLDVISRYIGMFILSVASCWCTIEAIRDPATSTADKALISVIWLLASIVYEIHTKKD